MTIVHITITILIKKMLFIFIKVLTYHLEHSLLFHKKAESKQHIHFNIIKLENRNQKTFVNVFQFTKNGSKKNTAVKHAVQYIVNNGMLFVTKDKEILIKTKYVNFIKKNWQIK
ncbi:hypothetical protein RFI_04544 [Reticulomyxa filosa]|uniref:Uncharacterized protein n=1 Tax=Reticulomyxa filosa TaxID=46433 RepID=X6P4R1_RETFI|nr:hypothetical protein RFI_04544 [Reticulomyxa filosa]|eukprot:ETO32572.1 hypothetical protein RFI_04544 [Reticulomyxa filosa]